MKLSFRTLNDKAALPAVENNILIFNSASPVILQSTEIKRVKTGLIVKIEENYSLQIGIHPALQDKDISVFPGVLIIDSSHTGELLIPLQNHGRGQVNLLPNEIIARGILTKIEEIEIVELALEEPKSSKEQTKPQKKNIEFKVHGRPE